MLCPLGFFISLSKLRNMYNGLNGSFYRFGGLLQVDPTLIGLSNFTIKRFKQIYSWKGLKEFSLFKCQVISQYNIYFEIF